MNTPTFADLMTAVESRQYPDESDQNVEILNSRLMAFARAGGPGAMASLYVWAKNLSENMPKRWKGQDLSIFPEQCAKAYRAMLILNGELKP